MLANLIESGRVARPAAGHGAASAVLHAGLAVVVVMAGPGGPQVGEAPAAREAVSFADASLPLLRAATRPPAADPAPSAAPAAPAAPRTVARPALPRLPELLPDAALEALALDVAAVGDVLDLAGVLPGAEEFHESSAGSSLGLLDNGAAGVGLDEPLSAWVVERPPVPYADNPRPEYPMALRGLGLQGQVEVQFVVDTMGLADARSMRVLRAAHALFTRSVERALPRMRFLAAERGGRKVRVVVSQLYTFELR